MPDCILNINMGADVSSSPFHRSGLVIWVAGIVHVDEDGTLRLH